MRTSPVRRLARLRAAYGAVLLCAPGSLVAVAAGRPGRPGVRTVARVLGARQLAQAGLTAALPRTGVTLLGVAADLAHAGSMLLLAASAPSHRRIAAVDAAVAGTLAAAGLSTERAARRRRRRAAAGLRRP